MTQRHEAAAEAAAAEHGEGALMVEAAEAAVAAEAAAEGKAVAEEAEAEAEAAEEAAEEAADAVEAAEVVAEEPTAAKLLPAKRPRAPGHGTWAGGPSKGDSISISEGDGAPPASQFGFTASKKRASHDAGAGTAGASPFAAPIEWSIK